MTYLSKVEKHIAANGQPAKCYHFGGKHGVDVDDAVLLKIKDKEHVATYSVYTGSWTIWDVETRRDVVTFLKGEHFELVYRQYIVAVIPRIPYTYDSCGSYFANRH